MKEKFWTLVISTIRSSAAILDGKESKKDTLATYDAAGALGAALGRYLADKCIEHKKEEAHVKVVSA